jgi:hypothetical protein
VSCIVVAAKDVIRVESNKISSIALSNGIVVVVVAVVVVL